jgi:putative transposase
VKSRYAKIRLLEKEHPVWELCELLEVARSGYYAWVARLERSPATPDTRIRDQIRQSFLDHCGRYGSPRITAALQRQGLHCNHKRVERVMRQEGLRARPRRRARPRTTDSQHDHPIAPNLLLQQEAPIAIDQVWVSDITYLPTAEGWLYLAGVMDLCSRKVVGWSMEKHLETSLPLQALRMALGQRKHPCNVIHHSDRGCQYTSTAYRLELAEHQMTASMSRRANCYDNAAMESFWSTLKTELPEATDCLPEAEVRRQVFEYIEAYYNRKRLHSSLGYKSPVEFENQTK